jgi:hypothetical protein
MEVVTIVCGEKCNSDAYYVIIMEELLDKLHYEYDFIIRKTCHI